MNSFDTPSTLTPTSREEEDYSIDGRDDDDEIISRSKKFNPNRTGGATFNQRSKFNKKIIWMKKLISPRIFLHQVCSFTLMLVLLFATRSVEAVFTPENRAALKTAVDTCVAETKDGSCPIYAGTNSNGAMDVWDVSKVTDMSDMFQEVTFNADISKWVRHQRCSSFFFINFVFVLILTVLPTFFHFLSFRTLTTINHYRLLHKSPVWPTCLIVVKNLNKTFQVGIQPKLQVWQPCFLLATVQLI
mgnify:CR=1 FL=1